MRFSADDLKRLTPFKVGLVYGAIASALVLIALVTVTATRAPEWALDLVVATLFIPFPFVVILAWAISAQPPENVQAPARRRRDVVGGPPRDR